VRAAVVAALRARADAFAPLFDTPRAFLRFCDDQACAATWGDELTLAAAADAFGVEVHVVQSTEENWHLCYTPEQPQAGGDAAAGKTRRVFVAYIAPVHYDAIVLA
jgi:hypothetical protein